MAAHVTDIGGTALAAVRHVLVCQVGNLVVSL